MICVAQYPADCSRCGAQLGLREQHASAVINRSFAKRHRLPQLRRSSIECHIASRNTETWRTVPSCSLSDRRVRKSRSLRHNAGPSPGATSNSDLEQFLAIANELADAAGEIVRPYFRSGVDVDLKGDESPVTVADRAAEEKMREIIGSKLPSHGVYGEEAGMDLRDGEYIWVLDPIDGTKSFITGKPLFGTLIALVHNNRPILGIIDQPILQERWVGAEGQETTFNGSPVSTKACSALSQAYMFSTTPRMFLPGAELEAYQRLCDEVREPLYGCDCYAYGLLAMGQCELVVEADLKPYDFMALIPIIEGAGGVFSDWAGRPLGLDPSAITAKGGPAVQVIAACDRGIHKQALEVLQWE